MKTWAERAKEAREQMARDIIETLRPKLVSLGLNKVEWIDDIDLNCIRVTFSNKDMELAISYDLDMESIDSELSRSDDEWVDSESFEDWDSVEKGLTDWLVGLFCECPNCGGLGEIGNDDGDAVECPACNGAGELPLFDTAA